MSNYSDVVKTAQTYYNSSDADTFYMTFWGGEDIHIGLYNTPEESIFDASRRTVERMTSLLGPIDENTRIIDIGAGYGGSGRYLAKKFGCKVVCLNLSEAQNERDRQMNKEQGLDHLIEVVDASFEDVPYGDNSFDIAWSQDSILHSGDRRRVFEEVKRVVKPGGQFIFTDPMQSDNNPEPDVLEPILARIHLDTLGSFATYRQLACEVGFEELNVVDLSEQLPTHYGRVAQEVRRRYDEIVGTISKEYLDRMLVGLGHWVNGGQSGNLSWGILHFRV